MALSKDLLNKVVYLSALCIYFFKMALHGLTKRPISCFPFFFGGGDGVLYYKVLLVRSFILGFNKRFLLLFFNGFYFFFWGGDRFCHSVWAS